MARGGHLTPISVKRAKTRLSAPGPTLCSVAQSECARPLALQPGACFPKVRPRQSHRYAILGIRERLAELPRGARDQRRVGHSSTVARRRGNKRCGRRRGVLSLLGIELGGHAAVGVIGFKLGWDAALGIALHAETRGAPRCRWVCGAIIPHVSVPVRYGLLFFDGAL